MFASSRLAPVPNIVLVVIFFFFFFSFCGIVVCSCHGGRHWDNHALLTGAVIAGLHVAIMECLVSDLT